MTRRLLLCWILALGLGAPGWAETANRTVRVMALGDSHTVGQGSTHRAGYRLAYLRRMAANGFDVDMVGGKADGPEGLDHRHQGYGGATTYELSGAVHEKMAKYDPDVVILLIGTNDARAAGFNPLAFEVHFSVLVDRIFASNPEVKLVVATIPPQMYGKNEPANRALNDRIKKHLEKRADHESIEIVDVYHMVDDRLDMSGPVHLNDAGYEKVGGAFADATLTLLRTDVAGSR